MSRGVRFARNETSGGWGLTAPSLALLVGIFHELARSRYAWGVSEIGITLL
jgi:hypothetical protein